MSKHVGYLITAINEKSPTSTSGTDTQIGALMTMMMQQQQSQSEQHIKYMEMQMQMQMQNNYIQLINRLVPQGVLANSPTKSDNADINKGDQSS